MKVLAFTNLYPTESAPTLGTFVKAQLDGLRELGVHVDMHYVDRASGGRRTYWSLARSVSDVVTKHEPDVVHVLYGGVMADAVTRSVADRPVVVTFYGRDLFGLPRSAPLLRRISGRYGVRASIRAAARASAVIVQSQMMVEILPPDVLQRPALVIPDGIDLDRFAPADRVACQEELGWERSRRHVLFPWSSARPEKRYELAQSAVARLNDGQGLAELHELQGVPHEEVAVWLNAADVVLLTSTHEGSPNAIKEALACNVPVVSVDVGDVAWLIDGISGCYLAEPTATDLSKKLALALATDERPTARARMAELSRTRIAQRIRDVYEQVLAR